MVLVCLLTHFTVSAMAVERFLGICHGYFYGRHVTPSRCRYVLAGIWVFCSLFSLLPLFNLASCFSSIPTRGASLTYTSVTTPRPDIASSPPHWDFSLLPTSSPS
ncbi:hypothetical protein Pcinc_032214 [Petrolisthes cinctipes]|uniref:G-protein coupled receptors family 1 profile domain-containing protein n=1 Tax=Petrolisthes cinctipes TaxID=88211 RepID=A0AAE1K1B7_PETCI|nr:hypothetical protein Pcinc_032214 [Petrolisthes cinctipes]